MAAKPAWMTPQQFQAAASKGESVQPLAKALTVAKLEMLPEGRRVRFVISTGDVDRDNDTIDPNGWELANYVNNPVVLWAHSHRDLPIARCVSIGVEGGSLVAVAEFATHPFAETVYQLLQGGFMRATSVGFRALEYSINEERRGVDFKRQELLEFSVCPVPANPYALVAASEAGVDLEPMRQWMAGLLADWPGELKLPGKAWQKVLGAAAAHVGHEPAAEKAREYPATLTVDTTAAMAELGKVEARLESICARAKAAGELVASAAGAAKDGDATGDGAAAGGAAGAAAGDGGGAAVAAGGAEATGAGGGEAAADEPLLELADEDGGEAALDVDVEELSAVLSGAVSAAMREMARESVERTLNQLRGRLD